MKKFKIKYQKGVDMLITTIQATDTKEAIYLFYMNNPDTAIEGIQEI